MIGVIGIVCFTAIVLCAIICIQWHAIRKDELVIESERVAGLIDALSQRIGEIDVMESIGDPEKVELVKLAITSYKE